MQQELLVQIKVELLRLATQIATQKPGSTEDDILEIFNKLTKAIF